MQSFVPIWIQHILKLKTTLPVSVILPMNDAVVFEDIVEIPVVDVSEPEPTPTVTEPVTEPTPTVAETVSEPTPTVTETVTESTPTVTETVSEPTPTEQLVLDETVEEVLPEDETA
jgi:hypothetical protein